MRVETEKQKASRMRNSLVMRLRGAACLFRIFESAPIPYKMSSQSALKSRVIAKKISWEIDEILDLMSAETESDRLKRLRKEVLEYRTKNF